MAQFDDTKLTVAVVGCGIGGLALGAFLSKFSVDNDIRILIEIYESKPEVSSLGSGVAIWKHSWEILQELGVEEDVVKRGFKVPKDGEAHGPIFRQSDQPTEGYDFHNHVMPCGPLGLPRPVLLDLLRTKLSDNCKIHTSKRLTGYTTESGTITLYFDDKSTAQADIIIGADGIHSVTRMTMFKALGETESKDFEKYIQPMWTGTLAYRGGMAKAPLAEAFPDHIVLSNPRSWCGKNKHVVSHPLGPSIGLICYTSQLELEDTDFTEPLIADVSTQEVVDLFKEWEPKLVQLIKRMQSPSRWAIHVVRPLPSYVSGHIALIGDAAHGMTPHQGVGGGQAIEDAYILARILTYKTTTKSTLVAALKVYDEIRRPPSQYAAEVSRSNGMMYEYNHPDFVYNSPGHPDGPSREELEKMGQALGKTFLWLAQGHIRDDWIKAQEMLEKI
ncbi:FAD/NAD(P)-binding domain-containing protein [Dendrothele bispora CBS 962.96]|uniref:FAD/NAD(P)-binding domain-containing protein n=1 Tax=Dendrothele bispora (strain CBS 962.96) TaxID=1314807 RepID=A0A4S8LUV0_DENBC|nr:FAD/NAD(P)-binding domain-containing protein [Dendrothele bispora CBS 962.96]